MRSIVAWAIRRTGDLLCAARARRYAISRVVFAGVLVGGLLTGANTAWAYSFVCASANAGNLNRSYSTPDLGRSTYLGFATTAGEVYTLTLNTTGGATVASLELSLGGQVNNVSNAGNGTVLTLTAAGGENPVGHATGATSGSGQITVTVTCAGVAPNITGVGPSSGPSTGGTSVTITGANFTGATAVKFGSASATQANVANDNTIVATAPAHAAGLVDIVVTTPAGTATSSNAYNFVAVTPAPVVTGIAPNAGPTAGGTNVVINGSDLTGASAVTIGGAAATNVVVVDAYTITATTPAHAAGAANVVVTTPGGSSAQAVSFIYSDQLYLTATSGVGQCTYVNSAFPAAFTTTVRDAGTNPVSGVTVTLTGPGSGAGIVTTSSVSNGSGDAVTTVMANGVAGAYYTVTASAPGATSISYSGMANRSPGATEVAATQGSGQSAMVNTAFALPLQATVTDGCNNPVSGATVSFAGPGSGAGIVATSAVTNASGIASATVTANAIAGGPYGVTAATSGATSATFMLTNTAASAPTVSGVTPSTGTTAGGTAVTITGTNMSGVTAMTFGGTAATNVVAVDATTVTATTPAHAAGPVDIVVTAPGGTGTGTNAFTYVAPPSPPTVATVSPGSGTTLGGSNVTITGTNLMGATAVTFGGTAASNVVIVNATTITATTPAHAAGPVDVVVTTPGGVGTGTNRFTYAAVPAPTFAAVNPNTGPTTGGTGVTITGTNFTGATAVTFGGTAATGVVVVDAATITATTPAHAAGAVDVVVTSPGGQATGSGAFTYVQANTDSAKLRQLQTTVTRLVAQTSGQAISGAVDAAIADAFGDGDEFVSQTGNALRFNFAAEPKSRVEDAFDALAFAGIATRAPPPRRAREWQAWLELRGTNWVTKIETGDIRGDQVNATFGVGRKLTPDLVVGVLAGVETFDYTSQLLAGRLKGAGWTAGGYLGWRLTSSLRFDTALAHSRLNYDMTAGTASGTTPGARWLASAGLTGTHKVAAWRFEPSLRTYLLWERQEAYVDTLGTAQAERTFSAGRASAGAKAAYLTVWGDATKLTPYLGLYGDYYVSSDDAAVAGPPPISVIAGWSARVTGGLDVNLKGGTTLSIGSEFGGIGGDHTLWTARGRFSTPF